MKHAASKVASIVTLAFIVACSKQETVETPQFDPKYIASEADKGNLEPLKDLNSICRSEVEKSGKRGSACKAQDEVGALRKPLALKF